MNTLPSVQKLTQTAAENMQMFQSYADIMLNASERLVSLNIEAARMACSLASSNVPVSADDFRAQLASRADVQSEALEQATKYFRDVNDLCIQTQSEVSELNTRRLNQITESVQALLDNVARSGPTGTADFVSAMKTAMSNATAAYESFVRTSRDVAENNLAAASNAMQPMVAAGKAARKAA
ncbi:MAG: phasin family protein [Aromatoleum sp.]|jgi:hypothetical protein|uniref:phasin family protein n=1 Tax=Aromatoleum sp. TaxID=2307007 RepID=UPI002894069C|nr:phasin family protein [Aromatoleum sp.]MDT3671173.1 phasin family protein [Aromatoleum sp.]